MMNREKIGKLGREEARTFLEVWVTTLPNEEPAKKACESIGIFGEECSPLTVWMYDQYSRVTSRRKNNLHRIGYSKTFVDALTGGELSLKILVGSLGHENFIVRQKVISGLVKMGPKAVPSLIEVLGQNQNSEARESAAEALGEMRFAFVAIPALVKALNDSDGWVRAKAALSLGVLVDKAKLRGVPVNIPAIIARLNAMAEWDAEPFARKAARESLAMIF